MKPRRTSRSWPGTKQTSFVIVTDCIHCPRNGVLCNWGLAATKQFALPSLGEGEAIYDLTINSDGIREENFGGVAIRVFKADLYCVTFRVRAWQIDYDVEDRRRGIHSPTFGMGENESRST